jgi:hypothetical protein
MSHTLTSGLIGLAALASIALSQPAPPERPHLFMWPQVVDVNGPTSVVEPNPASAIPIVRDDRNTGENRGTVYTPEAAANFAYNELRDADIGGWISRDHIALFPRYIGADLFVANAPDVAPYHPDTDPRTMRGSTQGGYNPWPSAWTFFYPEDRLSGLYDIRTIDTPSGAPAFPTSEQDFDTVNGVAYYAPGAGNRSFRHPFLVNATRNDQDPEHNSPLREYMRAYAAALRSQLDAPGSPLQGAQPTFIFDAEQAHIVQRPDKHSCIYMLWFLTQAKVPGASPTSTDENDFIWNRFKVPGSEGWWPPTARSGVSTSSRGTSGGGRWRGDGRRNSGRFSGRGRFHEVPVWA